MSGLYDRRNQFTGKTKKEAYDKMVDFITYTKEHGIKKKKSAYSETSSIVSILKNYEEKRYKNRDLKAGSFNRLKQTIKAISTFKFANIPIQKVKRTHIEKFLQEERTKANRTIMKEYCEIKKAFFVANKMKIIQENFFDGLDPIKCPKSFKENGKVDALSRQEEFLLTSTLNKSTSQYKNIVLLALYTGMRAGEILALSADNINWNDGEYGTVEINNTLTQDKNGNMIIRFFCKNRA